MTWYMLRMKRIINVIVETDPKTANAMPKAPKAVKTFK
jgi:hypothetical protein